MTVAIGSHEPRSYNGDELPFDFDACWFSHKASVLSPRPDEDRLHMSDLGACDYATWLRIQGVASLPHDDGSFANFERGYALEERLGPSIASFAATHGLESVAALEMDHFGIVGHIDFEIRRHGAPLIIVDTTGTAKKEPAWTYPHALKSAGYAVERNAPWFVEWVFCYGWGGTIKTQRAHWFRTEDWRERVLAAVDRIQELPMMAAPGPPKEPPIDPLALTEDAAFNLSDEELAFALEAGRETWRCEKYCNAQCPRNMRWDGVTF